MEWLKELLKDLPNATELEKAIAKGIGENFVSKADFNTVNDTKKQLEVDIKERDTQLETLKKSVGDNEELKKQIETLQEDNRTKDEEYQKQLKDLQLTNAINLALNGKVHDVDLVAGLVDKEKVIIGNDGNIVGLDEQIQSLQENKSFLFKGETTDPNNPTPGFQKIGNPPPNDPGAMEDAIAAAFGNTEK
ncbi:phage scaffolding protein [Tissierella sp. MSJ-40]|uniref:Phage scaffolding protein n=1 Tax=Tissierella simiarum TaxID=2841534 RepID=A0ABS6EAC9_9FIRM|nr:phage scaffolding protein [Tissierella simiarum]MBU5439491.1 phage scaffolding protein [Tissierella simiarum]